MEELVDAAVLDTIISSLHENGFLADGLGQIVQAAIETVTGADHASVTALDRDGTLETLAATSPLAEEADKLQYALHEGPCYHLVTQQADVEQLAEPARSLAKGLGRSLIYSPNLCLETRWPNFGPQVADLGLWSQLAIKLSGNDPVLRALNLYSHLENAFQESDGAALLFASHASVALGYTNQVETLSQAVSTRELIGKAIGIVMVRYHLSDERAFEFLIRCSNESNIKLRDIAAHLVAKANRAPSRTGRVGNLQMGTSEITAGLSPGTARS